METYNFSPNVIYFTLRAPDKSRQVTKVYEFNVPLSVLALGGRKKEILVMPWGQLSIILC